MSSIRILGEDDVRELIDSKAALALARRTLRDQAEGNSSLSTPSAMTLDATRFGGGRFKFKAASVGHLGASGIRLISRMSPTDTNAKNFCAVYRHGGLALSGLVAELWISRIRTAAFGTAVIELLANPGPLAVALFGSGKIAHEIVPMLGRALELRELRVNSRRPESTARFVAEHAASVPCQVRVEPDALRMVEGADVVVTLTEADTPLVRPGTLKPGAVVCSMGGRNEVDFDVLAEMQRFIVDDIDFAAEAGDGRAWIKQGKLTLDAFSARVDALACEVAGGLKRARLSPNDRILAIVQGMAIGDVAFAAYALEQAEKRGKGIAVELPGGGT
jgi:ornithine cyclodeaminase/alanine dehydrogenase-like protein (mu-crystallin family)